MKIERVKSSLEELCDKYERVLRMLTERDEDERHDQSSSQQVQDHPSSGDV